MTLLETAPVPNPRTGGTDWIGTILDPRNGNVYRASIAVDNTHHLRLHGYIGLPIFGLTQRWDAVFRADSGELPVGSVNKREKEALLF